MKEKEKQEGKGAGLSGLISGEGRAAGWISEETGLARWRIRGSVGGGWRLGSADPQEDSGGGGHGMGGTRSLISRVARYL